MPTMSSSVEEGLKPFAIRLTGTDEPGLLGSTPNQPKGPGAVSISSFSTRPFPLASVQKYLRVAISGNGFNAKIVLLSSELTNRE